MQKEYKINGLKLPALILQLEREGKWKLPEDKAAFKELFGEFGRDACLYDLEYMPFENGRPWLEEKNRMFLGVPDEDHFPGNIDPRQAVIIGDLGIGYDQPIALDYRENPESPRVLTLIWRGDFKTDNRWVVIAENIGVFLTKIGLHMD